MAFRQSPIYGLCKAQMSCIINALDEATKASLASGAVVLGLLPTLLAVISPSIAELALLSVHRPVLSTLISVGAPAVLQTRIFEYEDPAETLDLPDEYNGVTRLALALGPWSKRTSAIISAFEYLVVLASGVNVLVLCYQLAVRTVCSWGCTRSWPVLLWAVFTVVIHLFGSLGYRLTLDPATQYLGVPVLLHKTDSFFTVPPPVRKDSNLHASGNKVSGNGTTTTTTRDIPLLPLQGAQLPPRTTPPTMTQRIWAKLIRELLPCAGHPDTVINNRMPLAHPNTRVKVGIALNCVAGFLSCLHLLYGTVVFASFNFIHVLDALASVACRLLASCIACRLVILIEVAGMRGARMAAMSGGQTHPSNQALANSGLVVSGDPHGTSGVNFVGPDDHLPPNHKRRHQRRFGRM